VIRSSSSLLHPHSPFTFSRPPHIPALHCMHCTLRRCTSHPPRSPSLQFLPPPARVADTSFTTFFSALFSLSHSLSVHLFILVNQSKRVRTLFSSFISHSFIHPSIHSFIRSSFSSSSTAVAHSTMESLTSPPSSSLYALPCKQRNEHNTPPTSQPTSPSHNPARWTSASSSSSSFTLCSSASPGVLDTKMQDDDEGEEQEEEQDDDHESFLSSKQRRSRSLSTETMVSPSSPTVTTEALPSSIIPPPRYPDLPSEIILYIFRFLNSAHDLRSAILVCKLWCCCGMDLLWSKPSLLTMDVIERMIQTISLPKTVFPYADYIRRLNLSFLAPDLTDPLLTQFATCSRLERLLLAGSVKTTEAGLKQILTLSSCRGLYALDLSEIPAVTNSLLEHISLNCPQLHTLYLGSCPQITDDALIKIAARCTQLKRVR